MVKATANASVGMRVARKAESEELEAVLDDMAILMCRRVRRRTRTRLL